MEVGWRADTNIGGINVNGEKQGIIPDADLNHQPSRTVPPELFVNKKDLGEGLFNVRGDMAYQKFQLASILEATTDWKKPHSTPTSIRLPFYRT